MNKFLLSFAIIASSLFFTPSNAQAQGWPSEYEGVMLQGFYWDSYTHTRWTKLEAQAKQLATCFDLVWIPNSGYCAGHNNMGYMPLYFWDQNSSFGNEAELRSMISTFKQHGIGTIADVVINHHNTEGWFAFPKETYKGETYQFQSTDICKNDDGGATLTQAKKDGVSLSENNDTGEDWGGCRDMDHKSANVQRIVKAYEDYLLNDLGYAGFRYDMVKGFSPSFIAEYNTACKAQYSVGEYWDSSDNIKKWVDRTASDGVPTSAAFDFQFRYRVRDAFNGNDCKNLLADPANTGNYPLAYQESHRKWAVTFVENHDTQYRNENEPLDPLKKDTVAANAFMLAMPGTPCVFLAHWLDCKADIRRQITARRIAGIHSQSTYENIQNSPAAFANVVQGKKGSLIVAVGTSVGRYTPRNYTSTHTLILSGHHYKYYLSNELVEEWNEQLKAIEAEEEAEREEEESFVPYTATVYCKADFTPVYFYAWDSKGQLLGNWPGQLMEGKTKVVDGEEWYYEEFPIPTKDYEFNIIFNQGSGKPQTADIVGIKTTSFFTATISNGRVDYNNVTDEHETGIEEVKTENGGLKTDIYDLQGRRLGTLPAKGIYIQGGKKILR